MKKREEGIEFRRKRRREGRRKCWDNPIQTL